MATDPPFVARHRSPCPGNLKSNLVAHVHNHSRTVIEAELHRLARRVPSLGSANLNVIAAMLEELSESLILARLRNAPQATAPLLWRLFGTEEGPVMRSHRPATPAAR
jgi:hypothetical protein